MRIQLAATAALLLVAAVPFDDPPKPNDDTLGAKPPEGAVVLFDGDDLTAWTGLDGNPADWTLTEGGMTVNPGEGSIRTVEPLGSGKLHLEFAVPYEPDDKGQARGNSGVYITGSHEVQVLDSYGLDSKDNDCAGIYQQYAPTVNACKKPTEWQTYDITFTLAKVEGDEVVEPARITVVHNGITVIDDKPVKPTPGGVGTPEGSPGPLMLQDHGDLVQFRNIWFAPAEE